MALISILFFTLFFFVIILGYVLFFKSSSKLLIIAVLFVVVFLLLLGLTSYYSLIELESVKEYDKLGPFGDYIGGILNPLISFFAVIAAGFAFYAQYQANKQVQDQFKIQQFESQFYEMIRLHRENLNEIQIEGYVFDYENGKDKPAKQDSKKTKITTGKKVFVTMLNEFEAIHLICTKIFMFKYISLPGTTKINVELLIRQFIMDHSYYVFFNGIKFYSLNKDRYIQKDTTGFLSLVLNDFIKELKEKRDKYEANGIKEYHQYYITGSSLANDLLAKSLWLSFNYKPFSGHQSILAHYYRHLFQTVKYVVKQNENIIAYESKRDYLRILRSMLSNQEQILLYYNWLAGFGSQWEEKDFDKRKNRKGNYFFTDYRMIHNIPNQMLIDGNNIEDIFKEEYLSFRYECNRKDEDLLFELVGIKSKLKLI